MRLAVEGKLHLLAVPHRYRHRQDAQSDVKPLKLMDSEYSLKTVVFRYLVNW